MIYRPSVFGGFAIIFEPDPCTARVFAPVRGGIWWNCHSFVPYLPDLFRTKRHKARSLVIYKNGSSWFSQAKSALNGLEFSDRKLAKMVARGHPSLGRGAAVLPGIGRAAEPVGLCRARARQEGAERAASPPSTGPPARRVLARRREIRDQRDLHHAQRRVRLGCRHRTRSFKLVQGVCHDPSEQRQRKGHAHDPWAVAARPSPHVLDLPVVGLDALVLVLYTLFVRGQIEPGGVPSAVAGYCRLEAFLWIFLTIFSSVVQELPSLACFTACMIKDLPSLLVIPTVPAPCMESCRAPDAEQNYARSALGTDGPRRPFWRACDQKIRARSTHFWLDWYGKIRL